MYCAWLTSRSTVKPLLDVGSTLMEEPSASYRTWGYLVNRPLICSIAFLMSPAAGAIYHRPSVATSDHFNRPEKGNNTIQSTIFDSHKALRRAIGIGTLICLITSGGPSGAVKVMNLRDENNGSVFICPERFDVINTYECALNKDCLIGWHRDWQRIDADMASLINNRTS